MDYTDRQFDAILSRIEMVTIRKIEEKFSERLEAEIRTMVKAEIKRMFIKMKEVVGD